MNTGTLWHSLGGRGPVGGLAAAILVLALLLSPLPASAVVVELTNGQRIEGVLREASALRILLEAGGQVLVFEAGDVRAIYFNTAEAPPSTRPPASRPPVSRPPDAAQALEVVKALRATVEGGTSPPEYGPRVQEARAVIDRYLASSPLEPPPGGRALGEAMRYYQLAEFAWRNKSVASSIVWLQKDEALARCPGYRDFAGEMRAKGEPHYSERTRSFLQISDGVLSVLWSCAADQIADAEKAIPKPAIGPKSAGPAPAEAPNPDAAKAPGSKTDTQKTDVTKADKK